MENNDLKKRSSALWLLGLMKPFIPKLLLAGLLIVLANLADLIKPRIYKTIIEFLPGAAAGTAGSSGSFLTGTVTGLGISYFAVIFVSAAASLLQSRMITSVCQQILHETRMQLFMKTSCTFRAVFRMRKAFCSFSSVLLVLSAFNPSRSQAVRFAHATHSSQ